MVIKYLRLFISLIIAALFLWLALKDVSMQDVRLALGTISYFWLLPYVLITLLSHYLRAERWKQLIEKKGLKTSRLTLFSGVMLGYAVNYAIPRLGEVSRCLFVGNSEHISKSKLMGTVVLERGLDLLMMILLSLFVLLYIFTDYRLIVPVIGDETAIWLQKMISMDGFLVVGTITVIAVALLYLAYRLVLVSGEWFPSIEKFIHLLFDASRNFFSGLASFKDVKNWPLFLFLTAGIWFCYVLMTYIPFTAFDLHTSYSLGMREALVITVISAVGMSLPSPGGIGTYHWFVSQSLLLFYAVPETLGVAYAIATHLVLMILILLVTPLLLLLNKSDWIADLKNEALLPTEKKEP